MDIKQVVAMLQETGEVFIDCGQGCSRSVRVGDFRNITEDALEAIECAKFSPRKRVTGLIAFLTKENDNADECAAEHQSRRGRGGPLFV